MTTNKQLRELAEQQAWTGRWYDAGCETVICDYNGEYGDHMHGEVAHPEPTGAAVLSILDTIEILQAECEKLRSIISDIKDWDCDVSGGFLSIPLYLRRRMQEAIDTVMEKGG